MSNEDFSVTQEVDELHAVIIFNIELSKESDRGCVLLAASYLDNCLKDLLEANCIDDKDGFNDLCNGTSPLASFSGKIELCYLLGLISPDAKRYLHLIRKIRNDFAHSMEIISFSTERVANRCRNLRMEAFPKDMDSPRDIFMTASFGIAGYLMGQRDSSEKPSIGKDSFGNLEQHKAYMNGKGNKLKDAIIDRYYLND
ncbi:hypothetical protein [Paenibacillus amylolyticus]|uniref:hypothetical protein n=1 Tax=Paenibacillus amylolyticus TaxID=1451 RepID=UPI003D99E4A4